MGIGRQRHGARGTAAACVAVLALGGLGALGTPTGVARADDAPATTTTTTATTSTTTTSTTTTSTSTTPSTTAPPLRAFTVAVAGDVLTHLGVVRAACPNGRDCDFAPLLAATRPLVSATDLAICHLEVPIAPPGVRWTGYPVFGAPAAVTAGLAATGWDRCSTASNHSLDKGAAGIDATLDALDAAGLGHAGTARNAEEAAPAVFDVRGVRVAHLAYAYGFNGFRRPKNETWRANLLDPSAVLADAAAARAAGADVVIVSLHWGLEYHTAPTAEQRQIAHLLASSGLIDLVVGHHAHVLQPIEQVDGHWIVYGLGNHLSAQRAGGRPAGTEDGAIVTVRVAETAPGRFVVERPLAHATWVTPVTRKVLVVDDALADPAVPANTHRSLLASRTRTERVLGPFLAPRPAPDPAAH